MTPEQVLEEEDFVAPPPNARGAEAARAAQEAEYDARRDEQPGNTTQGDATDLPADQMDDGNNTIDDLHGSADDDVIDWQAEDAGLTADQRHDERVLERVERNRLDAMAQNGVILHGAAPEELHGGAPLAHTGSGTIVAVLLGAAAIGYTLRKALRA
jgi:hypothetical protein